MLDILRKYNFWDGQTIETGYYRKRYIETITQYLDNKLIKVILGQRRSGKSFLLRMIMKHLIENRGIPRQNILYINKDNMALDYIRNGERLLEIVELYKQALKPEGKIMIFLDEVQEIAGWERAVNSLAQDYVDRHELFVTGSNANLLSMELSTYLSGRDITFEVFPFSYGEYIDYNDLERGKQSFIEYLKAGGIPESCNLPNEEVKRNYLLSLKDSIVLRDIVKRHNVRSVYLMERIINFTIDTIGSLFSTNSVANYLKTNGIKTNSETIGNYLSYLAQSYFIHEVDRYDIRGKKILSGEKKYYLNDLAFKFLLSSSFDFAIGKYIENAVYLDLRRKGFEVYSGKLHNKEIDFIAEKGKTKIYIQVCYLLADNSVIEREFGNLEQIQDNYEKLVISLDDINLGNRNGIRHQNAWEFIE